MIRRKLTLLPATAIGIALLAGQPAQASDQKNLDACKSEAAKLYDEDALFRFKSMFGASKRTVLLNANTPSGRQIIECTIVKGKIASIARQDTYPAFADNK